MSEGEGWDSKSDGPYWGCLLFAVIFASMWMAVLVYLGVF